MYGKTIEKFVDPSKHCINVYEPTSYSEMDKMMVLANLQTTGYVGNEFAHKGAPSLEKCLIILEWLTGDSE